MTRQASKGEDAGQVRAGHPAHTLVAFRNAILTLFRWKGWANIATAIRHYAASVSCSLELIGVIPA